MKGGCLQSELNVSKTGVPILKFSSRYASSLMIKVIGTVNVKFICKQFHMLHNLHLLRRASPTLLIGHEIKVNTIDVVATIV